MNRSGDPHVPDESRAPDSPAERLRGAGRLRLRIHRLAGQRRQHHDQQPAGGRAVRAGAGAHRRRSSRRPPAARRSRTPPVSPTAARSPARPAPTASANCRRASRAARTLTRVPGLLYSLGGRTDVGLDRGAAPTADAAVVLTIQPGVVVFASTGVSWLAVNRGNRINAVGTADGADRVHQPRQRARSRHRRLAGPVGRRRAARPRADHRLHRRPRRHAGHGRLRAPDRRRGRSRLLRRCDAGRQQRHAASTCRSATPATCSPATASCSR